jgi:hypothetical protein
MRTMWRIQADMINHGYKLPDWNRKTSYCCYYTPHPNSYLLYGGWGIDSHTKFSKSKLLIAICSISLLLVFNSTITSEHEVKSSLSISPCHWWSIVNTRYSIHQVQHTWSTAHSYYCIHHVLHHPKIDCLPLSSSPSALSGPCCTQFSKFPQLWVNQWIESQLASHLPPDLPPPDRPPPSTPAISINYGLQVNRYPCSITASKCISEFNLISACQSIFKIARSQPPSASLSSIRSWPPSVSPCSVHRGLQVNFPVHTITSSMCISKFTHSASPDTPAMTLQCHLQPDWLYVYINRNLDG